jgi:hypothetical protein
MCCASVCKDANDHVPFVLEHHPKLEFYSAGSLKQQFVPLGHINLILSQPIFALTP